MRKDARLDKRQIAILKDYFGRSYDGETMEDIAKSHGISRKTLYTWKETDHGKHLHDKYLLDLSANSKPKYFQVLDREALKGSYKHMELYAKIHGLLAPQKQEITTKDESELKTTISQEMLDDIKERLGKSTTHITRVK
ncbi:MULTISPECIES: phBC6A51 family helix-turn-helix protein [Bacillaceae]|uniref:phBC6A51 family helix-turn-helix protein n=1 Tax=Bacillaceae TaxID=186817 RepID=UPI00065FA975|nr:MULTISPECIES: phBC6A51 family helix-turn-helix protein [Bacillaceae]MCF7620912.1 hypothetical protein [Peribacillus frigoritolerans]PRA87637.1 hypothetical protein CQ056_14280 [Peribacillus simplex]